METDRKVITFDPKDIPEGACHLYKWGSGKILICKEKGLIKIFKVEKEYEVYM